MVSGIPLVFGLGTRMSDPFVRMVFGAPIGSDPGSARLQALGLGALRPTKKLTPSS